MHPLSEVELRGVLQGSSLIFLSSMLDMCWICGFFQLVDYPHSQVLDSELFPLYSSR